MSYQNSQEVQIHHQTTNQIKSHFIVILLDLQL